MRMMIIVRAARHAPALSPAARPDTVCFCVARRVPAADGKLDLIEFSTLVDDVEQRGGVFAAPNALPPIDVVPTRVRAAFETFDTDRSGYIEAVELRRALRHYGIDLTEKQTADVLVQYDEHPDGKLDLTEFASLVRDAARGFVLSSGPGSPKMRAATGAARMADGAWRSNGGRLDASGAWPHHEAEEARLASLEPRDLTLTP